MHTKIASLIIAVTLSTGLAARAEFKVNGRVYDESAMFSFKNIQLGTTLKEFKKVKLTDLPLDAEVVDSTDPDFPERMRYMGGKDWVTCVYRRQSAINSQLTTTIANTVVVPTFAFIKSEHDYRLVRITLLGSIKNFSLIVNALTEKYGAPTLKSSTPNGPQDVWEWTQGESKIFVETSFNPSCRTTYSVNGVNPTTRVIEKTGKPSDDL